MSEKLETRKRVDFHGLMDILGVYSEDQFSGPWDHGIQPNDKYIDVRDRGDGTYDLRAAPEVFEPLNRRK